jgi:hypothetical protein
MFDHEVKTIGVMDLDQFKKSLEFIKSRLTEEEYEQLKTEYQFTIHTYDTESEENLC